MTQLVPLFKTCLKLRDDGYPDNTEFVWALTNPWDKNPSVIPRPLAHFAHKVLAPAPTLGEGMHELKQQVKKLLDRDLVNPSVEELRYSKIWEKEIIDIILDENPAQAAAEMWLRNNIPEINTCNENLDNMVCTKCKYNSENDLHTCPYSTEITDNDTFLCNCCDDCIQTCANNISITIDFK